MRPSALIWIAAGAAAVAAAVALAWPGGGGRDGSVPDAPVAAPTSTARARPPQPTAPATTTTMSTTSVAPATTTPTAAPPTTLITASGYRWEPKPATGPGIVAPGGALTKHLAEDIATAFQLDLADVEAAIAAVELPPEARGNPEGWLAPGRYELLDGAGAEELVQAMVARRVSQLDGRNVPRDEWHRVLTAASVIETETYNQNEKPRVARVLVNRLDGGGPLQMDSIILYPVPDTRIFTTAAERAADDTYNSYRHDGLPPTPISAPDEASLDAFLAPTPGDWWFYVTIDLESGETHYAATYDEHQANVDLLRAWLAENPTP